MALRTELEEQARNLADRLTELLNTTVTHGIRLRTFLQDDGEIGWVGYKITRDDPFPGEGIPLTIGKANPPAFLHIMLTLALDDEKAWLLTQRSTYGLYLDAGLEQVLFHYDYARDAADPYPVAHVQVEGGSDSLDELGRRTNQELILGHLHLPVGGKRYRPSVEDVVEFLIVEGLVQGHADWKVAVQRHREGFHKRQLMAAVRRDPESSAKQLRALGYTVQAPDESPKV